MTLNIFGAGMAGLLTARMLHHRNPTVFEAQSSLPNNHSALLRFRSSAIAEATGIPFRKVSVQKAVWYGGRLHTTANLRHNNLYSLKVTGKGSSRSILSLEPVERYIAPPDLIARLGAGLRIMYGEPLKEPREGVSTIPMPALASILGVSLPVAFEAKVISTLTLDITKPEVDLYQTVYFPSLDDSYYRASFTGSRFTVEYIAKPILPLLEEARTILWKCFGIRNAFWKNENPVLKSQRYGKLLEIDDAVRRSFIMYATDKHHIYSVGRFATWRQILLDDVVQDIRSVEKLLQQTDRYGMIKELTKA